MREDRQRWGGRANQEPELPAEHSEDAQGPRGRGAPDPSDYRFRPGWDGTAGIAPKVARDFHEAVRARGQSYFDKNRVTILGASPAEVAAKVRGTEKYKVRMRLQGEKLVSSCTCPFFGPSGEPCKHIWATILTVDARGLLVAGHSRPLRLVTESPRARGSQQQQQQQPQSPQQHRQPPPPRRGGPPIPRGPGLPGDDVDPGIVDPGYENGYPRGPGPAYGPASGHSHSQPGRGYGPGRPPLPGAGGYAPRPGRDGKVPKDRRSVRSGGFPPGASEPQGSSHRGPVYPQPSQHPRLKQRHPHAAKPPIPQRNAKRLLAYIVDVPASLNANQIVIDLARRLRRPNGDWSPLKPWWHSPTFPQNRYDPEDRDLLTLLGDGQTPPTRNESGGFGEAAGMKRFTIQTEKQAAVIEQLAKTGRLRIRRADGEEDPPVVRWDDRAPWRFGIDVRPEASGKRWSWRGVLRRGEDRMDLTEPLVLLPGIVLLGNGRAAKFDDVGIYLWMMRIRHEKEMFFSDSSQQDEKLERILAEAKVPPHELLDTIRLDEIRAPARPCLTLRTPRQNWGPDRLIGQLEFSYDTAIIPARWNGPLAVSTELGVVIHRDPEAEQAATLLLFEMGFRESKDHLAEPGALELPTKRVGQVTKDLVQAGWRVEAEGALIHPASEFKLSVTTGIDWFELGGSVDFGGQSVPLPEVLAAARRGDTMIELGDGSMGMLPEEWLKKYGLLADMGVEEDGRLRFGKAQAALLDSLLAAQPEIRVDSAFCKVRQALPCFDGVQPREAPMGFRGELRPYQREGLGWLEYLQKFDFGGILADDMGLGKTVQVLAFLQTRRARRLSKGPSLIVVPRSLVFNWMQEAERFTPRLRILDYTGPNRHALRDDFDAYDLIVTTYGTLRTDVVELSQITFEYVILDEAQAIKNADSQAAKAARLLKGRHRLAMTGTPIENHLGELWSIFEFLNPGMLGTASVFKKHAAGASGADENSRMLLARALRPFILRRTKQQVVQDLPEKVEQTLYCDMEPEQRKCYEDLRAHYRRALLRKDDASLNRSKIEILEALLRLRQAACHPGLIDESRASEPSAKLDMLLPQLAEVVEEGHKVLIFSQFTSFLALVRDRLDQEKIRYEYLDGRTRNRAERVERFQNDPEIPVFLISLKAGGLGLNLTAAGYVYLLDPWWNPAVEAQAIDRSHRIGQTQRVFAYRLICRGTVEQKILELQQKKRDLADAILNADNKGVMAGLTKDDLEFLLS